MSTFALHMDVSSHVQTYKIAKLWGLDNAICDTMLFHSAYSNSYVNLVSSRLSISRA